MYFWKIEKLKNDLLIKPLSESESFKYLFAYLASESLLLIFIDIDDITVPNLEFTNMWDVFSSINGFLINAIGVYYVYKCNKGANGDNFLQKFFSIGWVVGIRLIVLFLPLMLLLFFILSLSSTDFSSTNPYDVILFFIIDFLFYWLLGKHVKEVAK